MFACEYATGARGVSELRKSVFYVSDIIAYLDFESSVTCFEYELDYLVMHMQNCWTQLK